MFLRFLIYGQRHRGSIIKIYHLHAPIAGLEILWQANSGTAWLGHFDWMEDYLRVTICLKNDFHLIDCSSGEGARQDQLLAAIDCKLLGLGTQEYRLHKLLFTHCSVRKKLLRPEETRALEQPRGRLSAAPNTCLDVY